MDPPNTYADAGYAAAYAKLEFPGTYYLAFRDVPMLIRRHVGGAASNAAVRPRGLDFGCGAGRSTRFLRGLGFEVCGVDISEEMVARARRADPGGDYRLVENGTVGDLDAGSVDLVLAAFTFDNIPTAELKIGLLRRLAAVLKRDGRIVNLVSTPEIYWHEWASFSTRGFPENWRARSGDVVRIINTALDDRRPAEDTLWSDADYRSTYARAGLRVVETHRPLGRADEPFAWVSETSVAPWAIYVLAGEAA